MHGTRAVLTLLVVASAGAIAGSGLDAVAANHGTAPGTNYTVALPHDTDHYPGESGGPANATHFWTAAGAYERNGIEDGFDNASYIRFRSPSIDFSGCTADSTVVFGIDRDGDDPGTETDLDLERYVEARAFTDHSIVFDFYEGDDVRRPFEADRGGRQTGRSDGDGTLELYPDDQIVLAQGDPAPGGPCYVMPEESGWYQISSSVNGTTYEGLFVEVEDVRSHYFYVCVCNSSGEALETLGTPPSGPTDGTATATPTPTGTVTPTATPGGPSTVTPTPSPTESGPTPTEPPDRDGGNGADGGDSGELTPTFTPGFAPGFGPLATVTAVIGIALLAIRRLGST